MYTSTMFVFASAGMFQTSWDSIDRVNVLPWVLHHVLQQREFTRRQVDAASVPLHPALVRAQRQLARPRVPSPGSHHRRAAADTRTRAISSSRRKRLQTDNRQHPWSSAITRSSTPPRTLKESTRRSGRRERMLCSTAAPSISDKVKVKDQIDRKDLAV